MTGTDGESDEVLLTSEGFVEGTTSVLNIVAKNIGDVNKIIMRTSGTDTYQCSTIRIELETKFWDFDCQEEIACPKKCATMMLLAGA